MDRNRPAESSVPQLFLRPGTMEILVCGATALAYVGTLAFGFVYDDVPQILKNPAIQDWRYLPQYFTSHVWAAIYPKSAGNYYRPLFLLWLRVNYALFGAHPVGWHAASVVCHAVATWLVFRVAQQLTDNRIVAFAAALFFGLHPAHVENVAWISGVTDPLMACFVLGSCSAFLSFCESRKVSQLAWSLGLFVLALLSKETAIVLPAMIFTILWIRQPRISSPSRNDTHELPPKVMATMPWVAPYVLVAPIYIGVRYWALRGFAHPTVSISWREVFLTWPSVLWFYARHLLFPFPLSEFYSLDYVRRATGASLLLPLVLLLALGLALYCWIRTLPQKHVAVFALATIVLPLLPVLDLSSLTVGDIVHDRYLYLPSVGFTLLAGLLIADLGRRLPERQRILVVLALTCSVSLLFAALTLTAQTQWASDIQLYARGVESAPDNLTVRDNLANALMDASQPQRAILLYRDVLERNPTFWRSNYNLGFAYYKAGNAVAAESSLRRAMAIDSSDSDQYIYMALAELQLRKLPEAAEAARQAIARNPQARGYHFILGLICEAQDNRDAAVAAFKAELMQHPDNAPAVAELQKIEGSGALRP